MDIFFRRFTRQLTVRRQVPKLAKSRALRLTFFDTMVHIQVNRTALRPASAASIEDTIFPQ